MTATDERQLRVLAILHYIYGVLIAFGSLYMLMSVAMGVEMIRRPIPTASESFEDLGLGLVIVSVSGFLSGVILSAATIVAGKRLERRTHRVYCIVVAAINTLFVPLGTVLGIVTIVTLMRPSVIELFADSRYKRPLSGNRK